MAKKTSSFPLVLALASAAFLTAGWLMPSFPLLIFFGITPLLALADRTDAHSPLLEKMEHVLLALGVSLVTYALAVGGSLVTSLVTAIAFTLGFVAHAWVRQTLGVRTGKITVILFWLALEYLFLKVAPSKAVYLADTLRLQAEWTRWNHSTGYLGSSLWILAVNWCWYQCALRDTSFRWSWLIFGVLLLFGPGAYSYTLSVSPITRQEMVNLYEEMTALEDVTYLARGELIVRTAAWLSTLILLFTFVKRQTHKQ